MIPVCKSILKALNAIDNAGYLPVIRDAESAAASRHHTTVTIIDVMRDDVSVGRVRVATSSMDAPSISVFPPQGASLDEGEALQAELGMDIAGSNEHELRGTHRPMVPRY